jgi:CRP-like cAMP-binding protein
VEGERGDEVFILLCGEAAIVQGAGMGGRLLRVERAPSVIGEMAVLAAMPRSATVLAGAAGARVLRLNGSAFREVLNADPAVAEAVIRTLARRLRTAEQEGKEE